MKNAQLINLIATKEGKKVEEVRQNFTKVIEDLSDKDDGQSSDEHPQNEDMGYYDVHDYGQSEERLRESEQATLDTSKAESDDFHELDKTRDLINNHRNIKNGHSRAK